MVDDSPKFLVGIDFSYCSALALKKACEFLDGKNGQIIALHVVDESFIKKCSEHRFGNEPEIKRELFLEAKSKLKNFVRRATNGTQCQSIQLSVTEGIPYIEINKKAVEFGVDMIVIGSCAKDSDMDNIFFGSTAERVLRFITRPVLCVPPDSDLKISPKAMT